MSATRTATSVVATLLLSMHTAMAQMASPLVEAVDLNESDAHIDFVVQFACAMRYVGHDPSSRGKLLRVRLVPTSACAIAPSATFTPQYSPTPDPSIIQSIALDPLFAGELALTVQWQREESFVLAPGADLTGLRIRLLRPGSGASSRVFINEDIGPAAVYALNLESSAAPHDASALAHVKEQLGVTAYESRITLNGTTWYRLRVGPLAIRADAERLLVAARSIYPRAWLAIDDETSATTASIEPPVLPTRTIVSATRLSQQQLSELLDQARAALRARDHSTAIAALTKLVEQPEFPARSEALELLGLARERSRQLAHAKAEYEEYLRTYPDSGNIARVRQRLRALASATRRGADGRVTLDSASASPWRTYGSAAARYRRDTNRVESTNQSLSFTAQNSAISDFDAVARRKGLRFDLLARTSLGYQKDLLADGPGDRTRISSAYAELADRELGWSARLGRQSRAAGGLPGSFDGIHAGYQWLPHLRINATYGRAVESAYDSFAGERTLMGVSVDLGTFAQGWEASLYVVDQRDHGVLERRAVGAEARYLRPGRSVIGLIDYDVSFNEINSAVLLGALELPARWTTTFNVDHRKSPLLTTRNALLGQPVDSLDQFGMQLSTDELRQLAEDRTAESDTYSIALSRPLSERIQLSADVTKTGITALPIAGGSAALDADIDVTAYSIQLIGGSWITTNDFHLLGARYQSSRSSTLASVAWYTRFPLGEVWRVGPRLRVDELRGAANDFELVAFHSFAASRRARPAHLCDLGSGRGAGFQRAGSEQPGHDSIFLRRRVPMDVLTTRSACAVLWLVLHGCAAVAPAETRQYLDSITAATITASTKPWVFARERPEVAANLRDYLTVYWAEVNRSGERRTYLVARAWSTVGESSRLPANGAKLDLAADDRLFSIQPVVEEPRSFGIGEPIIPVRGRTERIWYYPIAPEALAYLVTARAVSATLNGQDFSAQYQIWRTLDAAE